jgi:hypothetical protein
MAHAGDCAQRSGMRGLKRPHRGRRLYSAAQTAFQREPNIDELKGVDLREHHRLSVVGVGEKVKTVDLIRPAPTPRGCHAIRGQARFSQARDP